VLGFPTNRDLLKKLDFMSGVLNNVEGIAKKINSKIDIISLSLVGLKVIQEKLNEILKKLEIDKSSFHFSKVKIENIIIEGRITKFTMTEFQSVDATLEGTKKNGKPADWDGNPTVELDNTLVATAEVIDHKTIRFSAIEDSVTVPTLVNVTVKVDADLGEGVEEQTATGSFIVEPGRLTGLKLTFGQPQDKA